MKYLALLLLLPLAACSYTMYLSGENENGGTVNLVTDLSQDEALAKANEHCHQYDKVARTVSMDSGSGTLKFVCQPGAGAAGAYPGL